METASTAAIVRVKLDELEVAKLWTWLKRGNGFDRTEFSGYLREEAIASNPNLSDRTSGLYQREVFCIKPKNREPRRERSANVK